MINDRSETIIVKCSTTFVDVQKEPNIIIACETDA